MRGLLSLLRRLSSGTLIYLLSPSRENVELAKLRSLDVERKRRARGDRSLSWHVRPMSRADIIPAVHLVHESFGGAAPGPSWRVTQLKIALDIEQRCTPWHWSRHAQLVAESLSSEGLLSIVEMWGENEGSVGNESAVSPQPCLFNLCVVPHARRSGIARALLDACEDACLDWGGRELFLKAESHAWMLRRPPLPGHPSDVHATLVGSDGQRGSVLALRRSWLRRAGIPDDVLGWRARLAGWLEGWRGRAAPADAQAAQPRRDGHASSRTRVPLRRA